MFVVLTAISPDNRVQSAAAIQSIGETLMSIIGKPLTSDTFSPHGSSMVLVNTTTTQGGPGQSKNTTTTSLRIGPDGITTGDPVTSSTTSSDNVAQVSSSHAVFVGTESNGVTQNTAVISVSDKSDGHGQTIAVKVCDANAADGVSTVTLDSGALSDGRSYAVGITSKDSVSGAVNSLVLILPDMNNDGTPSGGTTFVMSSVAKAETLDPLAGFSNSGFTTLSAGALGYSYGGAVTIEVDGKLVIVWLDAGQNIGSGFTGQVAARFGALSASGTSGSGSYIGDIHPVTLVFTNGALTELRDGNTLIENFDAYVRDLVANTEPFPDFTPEQQSLQSSNLAEQGLQFVNSYTGIMEAIARNVKPEDDPYARLARWLPPNVPQHSFSKPDVQPRPR
jgi:hypothetical protein